MQSRLTDGPKRLSLCLVVALLAAAASSAGLAHEKKSPAPEGTTSAEPRGQGMMAPMMQGQGLQMMQGMNRLMMPQMDPALGRKLFASKGCVAWHSINGVGGHDATPLDAHTMDRMMNPFEFAAKMWSMAPAMIYAQEEALGYQITFTGDELAAIIAFVHHDEEQHKFSEADIPPEVQKMMNHTHGEPGGGPETHGPEIGHKHHMEGDQHQPRHQE